MNFDVSKLNKRINEINERYKNSSDSLNESKEWFNMDLFDINEEDEYSDEISDGAEEIEEIETDEHEEDYDELEDTDSVDEVEDAEEEDDVVALEPADDDDDYEEEDEDFYEDEDSTEGIDESSEDLDILGDEDPESYIICNECGNEMSLTEEVTKCSECQSEDIELVSHNHSMSELTEFEEIQFDEDIETFETSESFLEDAYDSILATMDKHHPKESNKVKYATELQKRIDSYMKKNDLKQVDINVSKVYKLDEDVDVITQDKDDKHIYQVILGKKVDGVGKFAFSHNISPKDLSSRLNNTKGFYNKLTNNNKADNIFNGYYRKG